MKTRVMRERYMHDMKYEPFALTEQTGMDTEGETLRTASRLYCSGRSQLELAHRLISTCAPFVCIRIVLLFSFTLDRLAGRCSNTGFPAHRHPATHAPPCCGAAVARTRSSATTVFLLLYSAPLDCISAIKDQQQQQWLASSSWVSSSRGGFPAGHWPSCKRV